jgi:hypothetical protein
VSDTQEPVAWAALNDDGDVAWIGYTADAAADGSSGRAIVPLYRHPQPTLTEEEREAIAWIALTHSRLKIVGHRPGRTPEQDLDAVWGFLDRTK